MQATRNGVEVGAARADRLEAAHVEEAEPNLSPVEARWVQLILLHTTSTVILLLGKPCSPAR